MTILIGGGVGFMMPADFDAPAPVPATARAEPRTQANVAEMETGETPGLGVEATPGETILHRSGNGHFYVDAQVDGHVVNFVVDTGATGVALTVEDARRIGIDFNESDFEVVGTGASGAVRGTQIMLDSVSVDGKEVRKVQAAVLEGLEVSLLGQSYLTRIGSVEMSGEKMSLR